VAYYVCKNDEGLGYDKEKVECLNLETTHKNGNNAALVINGTKLNMLFNELADKHRKKKKFNIISFFYIFPYMSTVNSVIWKTHI